MVITLLAPHRDARETMEKYSPDNIILREKVIHERERHTPMVMLKAAKGGGRGGGRGGGAVKGHAAYVRSRGIGAVVAPGVVEGGCRQRVGGGPFRTPDNGNGPTVPLSTMCPVFMNSGIFLKAVATLTSQETVNYVRDANMLLVSYHLTDIRSGEKG